MKFKAKYFRKEIFFEDNIEFLIKNFDYRKEIRSSDGEKFYISEIDDIQIIACEENFKEMVWIKQ